MRLCKYFVKIEAKTPGNININRYICIYIYIYIYIYKHPLSKMLQFENIRKIYTYLWFSYQKEILLVRN